MERYFLKLVLSKKGDEGNESKIVSYQLFSSESKEKAEKVMEDILGQYEIIDLPN